jgi:hypothetical protein
MELAVKTLLKKVIEIYIVAGNHRVYGCQNLSKIYPNTANFKFRIAHLFTSVLDQQTIEYLRYFMKLMSSYKSNNTAAVIEKISLASSLEFCRRKLQSFSENSKTVLTSSLSQKISILAKNGFTQSCSLKNYLFEISIKPLFEKQIKLLKTLSSADNIFQMISVSRCYF